jgi:hypothetical protein
MCGNELRRINRKVRSLPKVGCAQAQETDEPRNDQKQRRVYASVERAQPIL